MIARTEFIGGPHPDKGTLADLLKHSSGHDSDAVLRHVEACETCQVQLETLLADGVSWREAGRMLREDEFDVVQPFEQHDSLRCNSVTFLDPSDRPESLGRFGRYEIVEILGRGGMGIVMRGFDPDLNRYSAIKVLAPELASSAAARKRFSREAKSAAAVVHPHVVPIQTVDHHEGLPYLVMPVVEGQSLQQRGERDGPLSIIEAVRIAAQVAEGLAAAHQQGLVHRDIKPANILLENGVERVQITDFGLARAIDDASMTRSGVIAGTPQYMSPEQAHGDSIDHRSDLFSLGSLIYFMLTGRSPFRAETTMGVLHRITGDQPRSLRSINADVPQWLDAILMKLLSKSADDRYLDASEVAELLQSWHAHLQQPDVVAASQKLAKGRDPSGAIKPDGLRRSANRRPPRSWLIGLAMLGFVAFATVIVLETDKGTIRIETDSDVPVRISRSGEKVGEMTVSTDGKSMRVRSGRYQIVIAADEGDYEVSRNEFVLRRGESEVVRITQSVDQESDLLKPREPETLTQAERHATEVATAKAKPQGQDDSVDHHNWIPSRPIGRIIKLDQGHVVVSSGNDIDLRTGTRIFKWPFAGSVAEIVEIGSNRLEARILLNDPQTPFKVGDPVYGISYGTYFDNGSQLGASGRVSDQPAMAGVTEIDRTAPFNEGEQAFAAEKRSLSPLHELPDSDEESQETLPVAKHIEARRIDFKRIGLALHNYPETHGRFPSIRNYRPGDTDKKYPNSWRVAILPFLETGDDTAKELYDAYHFDEPYDGPDNRKLISMIPECFGSTSANLGEGPTNVLGVANGDEPLGSLPRPSTDSPKDGDQVKVIVTESVKHHVWTKPIDIAGLDDVIQNTPKSPYLNILSDGRVRLSSHSVVELAESRDRAKLIETNPESLLAMLESYNQSTREERQKKFDPPIPDLTLEQLVVAFRAGAENYRKAGDPKLAKALDASADAQRLTVGLSFHEFVTGTQATSEETEELSFKQYLPALSYKVDSNSSKAVVLSKAELRWSRDGWSSPNWGQIHPPITGQWELHEVERNGKTLDEAAFLSICEQHPWSELLIEQETLALMDTYLRQMFNLTLEYGQVLPMFTLHHAEGDHHEGVFMSDAFINNKTLKIAINFDGDAIPKTFHTKGAGTTLLKYRRNGS